MNQQAKNTSLAKDLKDFLTVNKIGDTRVYFNGICYHFDSRGNSKTIEDIKATTYFEYGNDETVSMSFEGELNHALNYGMDKKLVKEFNKIFDRHGCYYEFGYAWSLSVYY